MAEAHRKEGFECLGVTQPMGDLVKSFRTATVPRAQVLSCCRIDLTKNSSPRTGSGPAVLICEASLRRVPLENAECADLMFTARAKTSRHLPNEHPA